MALLDALSAHSDPVSLKHLARATGLHPSTAHRILNDLVVGRYVDRAETPGSYRLGMRLLELGNLGQGTLVGARGGTWSRCVSCTSEPVRQ